MSKPFFIDEKVNIITGNDALEALSKENDGKFLSEDKGIVRVSAERWKKSQECEWNHWLVKALRAGNDRNDYHFQQFNKYIDLKNRSFNSMLEIGCGPFTNSRIIARICKVENCSLLDPLISKYVDHPFCSYDKRYLYSEIFPLMGKIIRKTFPVAYKLYQKLLTRKSKIKEFLNMPAEEMSASNKYDLVIMINVIEHCYDAELVFQNILDSTNEDSYFVFADKLYNHEKVKNAVKTGYDAAHPLKVDEKVIDKFLNGNFEVVYKRIQTNSMFLEGEKQLWDDIYFIGKRK